MVIFSLTNGATFSGKALFDTGNAKSPLTINSLFKEENHLIEKIESVFSTASEGFNTRENSKPAIIATLKFGNFTFSKIPIHLSESKEGVLAWKGYLGLLGIELISKFNFILDYKSKKIYYRPNDNFEKDFE